MFYCILSLTENIGIDAKIPSKNSTHPPDLICVNLIAMLLDVSSDPRDYKVVGSISHLMFENNHFTTNHRDQQKVIRKSQ